MKRFYASLAALTVVVSGVLLLNILGASSSAALPRDCDNNSIIHCGGITSAELAQRYNENKTGDLPAIFQAYGLSAQEMTNAGNVAKMGEVRKDGTVVVGGEVVATDAMSIGRQNIFSGSTPKNIGGKTYYDSPPSRSFARDSIVAYVFFNEKGEFKAAVLTSCANPVTGKPKPKPAYKCNNLAATKISRTEYSFGANATATGGATIASYTYDFGDGQKITSNDATVKHTYAKPGTYIATLTVTVNVNGETKTISGAECETKIIVENPPEEPVYTCDSLTADRISRTEYSFTGKASAEGGATIVNYVIDFGDSKSETVTNPNNVRHIYAKDGTYTARLTATVKLADGEKTVTDDTKCVVKVNVTPDECKPNIPVGDARCTPPPAELPRTGPLDMLGGGIGIGSVVGATYYWRASRRGLLAELLSK